MKAIQCDAIMSFVCRNLEATELPRIHTEDIVAQRVPIHNVVLFTQHDVGCALLGH